MVSIRARHLHRFSDVGRLFMHITVKLYASFREIVGAKEERIEVPDGTTVQMLLEEYIKRFPRIGKFREHVILSVNKEYGHPTRKLNDGDEVTFLPPVSGG
jgi:molybdopterin converting factor subunit 1